MNGSLRNGLILVVLFLSGCAGPLVKKNELNRLKETLKNSVFIAKEDIMPDFAENVYERSSRLLKKGERVTLSVEATSTWIKVKAYNVNEGREQASGTVAIYLFKDDLSDIPKRKRGDYIEQRIHKLFIMRKK